MNQTENKPTRPITLWIIGILAMLDAGFSCISYLAWALSPAYMQRSLETIRPMNIFPSEQLDDILALYNSIQSWQFLLLAVMSALLFIGAFIMLVKMKKIGFHIYTFGKIFEFCLLNFVIGGRVAMNGSGIVMSILWVLLFAMQLRFMEPNENQDNSNSTQSISNSSSDNNQPNE